MTLASPNTAASSRSRLSFPFILQSAFRFVIPIFALPFGLGSFVIRASFRLGSFVIRASPRQGVRITENGLAK